MPAEYNILADRNLVHIPFSGVMTRSDMLRMRTALVTEAEYRAGVV